ncbi:MAG: ATP-binding cassette domain-containing protein [Pirellulaceae bacterium]|nr:ATP-binding cassette domain-containing protein [Pirellulaceae bacterium]
MIVVEKLYLQAGSFRLNDISLAVPNGSYAVLMGRTGSGKTTLLEAITGLKKAQSGRILLDEQDVTNWRPAERNIGYVPQDGALFTTMKVREQLAFALTVRRQPRQLIQQRVEELSHLLHIEHLLDRTIHGLSGGERQRVALGRALSFRPTTLCLDEPLSALDDDTRQRMYTLLEQVRRQTGVTTLHVTHNLEEAVQLADQLFRVEGGQVTAVPVPGRV